MKIIPPQEIYWSNATLALYIFIAIISFFLPSLGIVSVKVQNRVKKIPIGLIVNTLILITIRGCAGIGNDMVGGYQSNFWRSDSLSDFPDKTVEIGYRLLNVIVYNIFHNYSALIFIISFFTILPVSYYAWKYRNLFDMNIVMGLYVCIWYFQGLSLMRLYLASSIALIAFVNEVKHKPLKSFIWIIISSLFHITTIVLLIPWVIIFGKGLSKKIYITALIVFFIVIYIFRDQLVAVFGGRYSMYGLATGEVGLEEILYYLPVFAIIYYGHKYAEKQKLDDQLYLISNSYSLSGFGMGMLKYAITIWGRMQTLFLPLAFIISYYFKIINKKNKNYIFWKILVIIYGIIRLFIYLEEYYDLDGIMPYTTFWGWKF